jgi:hypothetical protein
MITGDHRAPALAFAQTLGIDAVHYEQNPEDKATIIAALQQEGRRVAYIGDGVNDGPALMVADVGISMPRAADIARATADIVFAGRQTRFRRDDAWRRSAGDAPHPFEFPNRGWREFGDSGRGGVGAPFSDRRSHAA